MPFLRVIPSNRSHRALAGKTTSARDRNRFGFFQPLKKNLNLGVHPESTHVRPHCYGLPRMWDRTCYSRSIVLVRACEKEGRGCRGAGSQPPISSRPDTGGARPQGRCLLQHREQMGEWEALPPSAVLAAASNDRKGGSKPARASTLAQTNEEAMSEGAERTIGLALDE